MISFDPFEFNFGEPQAAKATPPMYESKAQTPAPTPVEIIYPEDCYVCHTDTTQLHTSMVVLRRYEKPTPHGMTFCSRCYEVHVVKSPISGL